MAIQKPVPTTIKNVSTLSLQPGKSLNARDRLLNTLNNIPRLSLEDAEAMNRVVQEARDASIVGELSS